MPIRVIKGKPIRSKVSTDWIGSALISQLYCGFGHSLSQKQHFRPRAAIHENRAETVPPRSHRLVTEIDAALERCIFHVS